MEILKMRSMLSQGKSIYDLPLRVAYYARVSTEREEQLNSLGSQVMYFEDMIKKEPNWEFVKGYVDEGISGASVNKRESFLQMIEDAKTGMFDLLVTKEVSRFARNTLDSIKYTQELLSNNVGVYFISDNINTYDPDSELRLTIMSSIAQEEIRKLSDRVKFGYKRSVEKGVVAGSNNILGYKKNKGKLVIDEKEAEIIKKIFELYVYDDIGTPKLSYELYNKYGFTNSKGKPIHPANIRDIIRNPKYKGYYCAHKGETIDFRTKKRKQNKKSEWVVYQDYENVPPIVSEELWNEANKKLEARGDKHSNEDKTIYTQRFPLTQKLVCKHDNCVYTRGNWKTKNGKRTYWGCTCYLKLGKPKSESCNSPLLYETELAKAFKPIIKTIIENSNSIIEEIKNLLNEASEKTDYSKDIEKLENKIKEVEKQKDNLFEMRSSGEITAREFLSFKEKLNSKIDSYNEKKDNLINLEKNKSVAIDSVDELKKMIDEIINVDDDNIFIIASSIFEKIIVETIRDKDENRRSLLHCQLKLPDSKRENLTLSQLSQITRSDARFCCTIRKKSRMYSSI